MSEDSDSESTLSSLTSSSSSSLPVNMPTFRRPASGFRLPGEGPLHGLSAPKLPSIAQWETLGNPIKHVMQQLFHDIALEWPLDAHALLSLTTGYSFYHEHVKERLGRYVLRQSRAGTISITAPGCQGVSGDQELFAIS